MAGEIYTLLHVDTKYPLDSNVVGLYDSKKKAVENLIKRAGYTVDSTGQLLRHSNPQVIWSSYEELYGHVYENGILIYRRIDCDTTIIYALTAFSGVE